MSACEAPVYRRGNKYWLDWDRKKDGTLRSPYLTIFWYDPDDRRVKTASTGTAEEDEAIIALDRRYLADRGEAPAFCELCGQPRASADAYLLSDAISDYRLEWGDSRSSADSIEARLNHVLDFLEAEEASGGRFGIETSCAVACGRTFVEAFRAWSKDQPVVWKTKEGVVTHSRARSPATTEESVIQLCAALNHAANADPPRSSKRPTYKNLPRKQVSRPRRTRVEIATIADMIAYAAAEKRASLHAFLVASVCTLARPDAIVDIGVAPDRDQWWRDSPTLDLNQHGRAQTKKFRPIVPVVSVLQQWLLAELDAYEALPRDKRAGAGFLVNYHGRPVLNVKRSWATMLKDLKLPNGREWKPYLLRHSLATVLRNRSVVAWDLEGMMGHRRRSQTETYAIGQFSTVVTAIEDILGEIETRAPGALLRTGTGAGLSIISRENRKMSG